ncbi:methionyl-tRNA formyltransferase [Candidatus Peregrinibacteria bacterium RIFCSPLOWO2_02_FULL_39_10]|nr:MAG: methionyl-tRNA formyltransferase [Candidatus Peregrinibacteria bacterium RIFCSPLOWO2_02_FULL_39_10]
MKIIFFGTPEFAVPILNKLNSDSDIEILTVVTQKDQPSGRKKLLTPPPVKLSAEKLQIPIIQPKNKEELEKSLEKYKADFFVVVAYGLIFSKKILDMPKIAAINIHASLLPKYRGASPIQKSLLNNDTETGVSIIKMSEKLDQGDIYLVRRIQINKNDNFESLSKRLSDLSGNIITYALHDIEAEILSSLPQNQTNQTSYCREIKKTDGEIKWNFSAEKIKNMIRAYTPWPGVFTTFNNKKIKIIEAEISEENLKEKPGTFILDGKTLKIATVKGEILPQKLQIEGKKEIRVHEFINGNRKYLKTL